MGKDWARNGQGFGKEWAKNGQRMGKEWAKNGQCIDNGCSKIAQRFGKDLLIKTLLNYLRRTKQKGKKSKFKRFKTKISFR